MITVLVVMAVFASPVALSFIGEWRFDKRITPELIAYGYCAPCVEAAGKMGFHWCLLWGFIWILMLVMGISPRDYVERMHRFGDRRQLAFLDDFRHRADRCPIQTPVAPSCGCGRCVVDFEAPQPPDEP